MPISVGNGQQIAPQLPKSRRKPTQKKPAVEPGAEGFRRILGFGDLSTPRPIERAIRDGNRRLKRLADRMPGRPSVREIKERYRRNVRDVYDATSPADRNAILARAMRNRSAEGDIVLEHVTGFRGRELDRFLRDLAVVEQPKRSVFDKIGSFIGDATDAGHDLARFTGLIDEMPGKRTRGGQRVLARIGDILGMPDSDLVESALTNPRAFLNSPDATRNPGLTSTVRLQKLIGDATAGLTGAIDEGERRGLLGSNDLQSAGLGGDMGQLGVNALKDAVNLPAQVIPSAVIPASQIAEGDVEGAARDLAQPYIDLARDPGRVAYDHPLNTALMVYGPATGASRAVGGAGRRLGVPGFSTERAPQVVPGTRIAKPRSYSNDPVIKAGQVGLEKAKLAQIRRLERRAEATLQQARRQPERAAALEEKAAALLDQAARLHPNRIADARDRGGFSNTLRGGQIGRFVDEIEGINQSIAAAHRPEVINPVRKMNRQARGADEAISLLAQSIVRPDTRSVRAYRDHLTSIRDDLTPAEAKANRALVKGLDRVLKRAERGRVDLAEVRSLTEQHYGPLVKRLESELAARHILPRGRAERAKVLPFAAQQLRTTALPTSAIRRAMDDEGHGEPFFVSQAPARRGGGNFYRHWSNPGTVGPQGRTGTATVRGTFDAHPETLVEQVARMQGLVDAHDGWGRFLDMAAFRRRGGNRTEYQTRAQAQRAADELNAVPGSHGWAVVRTTPWKGRTESVSSMLDGTLPQEAAMQSLSDVMRDAIDGQGEGPFSIVPAEAAQRMRKHVDVLNSGAIRKSWRKFTGMFSRAVLTTSTGWMAGNAIEGALRTGVARAHPLDARFFRAVADEIRRTNPRLAEQVEMFGRPGGHFAFVRRGTRNSAEQFERSAPAVANVARALERAANVGKGPLRPAQLGNVWDAYTRGVFWLNEKMTEAPFQQALAGQYLRRRFAPGKGMAVSRKAVEQAARGLTGTAEQVAMARYVREQYGKYAHFSPTGRFAKEGLPFFAWAVNAARFLYVVLPKNHPVLTALLADMNMASEDWRTSRGLDKFMGRGQLPDFLQGSIPLGDGRHQRIGRFTPFSLAASPSETAAGLLLPQISAALNAAEGTDWKGRPLRNSDGTPYNEGQKMLYAAWQLLQGTMPGLAPGVRFAEAEGDVGDRANRVFNPFRPTAARRTRGGGSGPVVDLPTVRLPRVRIRTPTVELPTIR